MGTFCAFVCHKKLTPFFTSKEENHIRNPWPINAWYIYLHLVDFMVKCRKLYQSHGCYGLGNYDKAKQFMASVGRYTVLWSYMGEEPNLFLYLFHFSHHFCGCPISFVQKVQNNSPETNFETSIDSRFGIAWSISRKVRCSLRHSNTCSWCCCRWTPWWFFRERILLFLLGTATPPNTSSRTEGLDK